MASETAVLASNVGGIPEQVSHDETGILIEPGDSETLVKSYNELVRDQGILQEMGERGRERLESEGWTWDGYAEKVAGVYREILAGR